MSNNSILDNVCKLYGSIVLSKGDVLCLLCELINNYENCIIEYFNNRVS
jgi:hypothetical protein